jgi:hypothetical protein
LLFERVELPADLYFAGAYKKMELTSIMDPEAAMTQVAQRRESGLFGQSWDGLQQWIPGVLRLPLL